MLIRQDKRIFFEKSSNQRLLSSYPKTKKLNSNVFMFIIYVFFMKTRITSISLSKIQTIIF